MRPDYGQLAIEQTLGLDKDYSSGQKLYVGLLINAYLAYHKRKARNQISEISKWLLGRRDVPVPFNDLCIELDISSRRVRKIFAQVRDKPAVRHHI